MSKNDLHYVWNSRSERLKCFTFEGINIWERPCRNRVVAPHRACAAGEYTLGMPVKVKTETTKFGPYYIPLHGGDSEERGIYIHGGGSGSKDPLAPRQGWIKTHGCFRLQNGDLLAMVLHVRTALKAGGTVRFTVVRQ